MGSYVNIQAQSGLEDQVNMLWKKRFPNSSPDFLIYTTEIIKDEIAKIQDGTYPEFSHLKSSVRSVREWNEAFPIMAEGRGQIFISHSESNAGAKHLKDKLQFLLDNARLFRSVVHCCDYKDYSASSAPGF